MDGWMGGGWLLGWVGEWTDGWTDEKQVILNSTKKYSYYLVMLLSI